MEVSPGAVDCCETGVIDSGIILEEVRKSFVNPWPATEMFQGKYKDVFEGRVIRDKIWYKGNCWGRFFRYGEAGRVIWPLSGSHWYERIHSGCSTFHFVGSFRQCLLHGE